MKRGFAVVLLAALLVLTSACGQTGPATGGTQQGQTGQERPAQLSGKPLKKEVAVSELYSEDGTGTDSEGVEFRYSYHVPQIEDDTADAAAINQEIAAYYGNRAADGLLCVENGAAPACSTVSYECYRCGDVLALVVRCAYYYDNDEEYSVYNYDTANGVRLSNEDLLAMRGVTQEQALSAIRRAAAACYDEQYFPAWVGSGFDTAAGAYQELRAWTISEDNITPELPLYLDDSGAMHTIAAIGCHAGVSWLLETLTLDLEDNAADVETETSLDYLTVTRRGREVTFHWNDTLQGAALLEAYGYPDDIPYGQELTVNGLYGDYTQVFCGAMGEPETPYVLLLTPEGRVEYIDVLTCLQAGYCCAGGPLLGAADVRSFTTDTDENGLRRIYAVTGGGEQIDLWNLIDADRHSLSEGLYGDWSRNCTADDGSETFCWLTLADGGNFEQTSYTPARDLRMEFTGNLPYLGMTEQGLVFAYRSWSVFSNGPGLCGAVALRTAYDYGTGEYTLYVTELGGTPLLGEQTGDTTALAQTFG